MSDFTVFLAPDAERDIAGALTWYRERSAIAADAFRAEIFDTIDSILHAPWTRPPDDEGNRRRVLRRFPYTVIYEIEGTVVTVIAVAHHRRKPGYWLAPHNK